MDTRLDDIDRRILYHLAANARDTTAPDIADEVNVSSATIRNRISQLEERGVIRGYHADIDYERGEGLLTHLYTCTTPVSERDRLVHRVLTIPGVVNVREIMTGKGDLQIKAVGSDTEELTQIGQAIVDLGIEIEDQKHLKREHFHPYHPYGPADTPHQPSITDVMDLAGEAEIVELTVQEGAPITGLTLEAANEKELIDDDTLVVAIERGSEMITPRGETRVRTGDIVTLFIRDGTPSDAGSIFAPESSHPEH